MLLKPSQKSQREKNPHPKQVVYGGQAVDFFFFGGLGVGDFDMTKFFDVTTPNRITTLA